jgi:hypothetical protein
MLARRICAPVRSFYLISLRRPTYRPWNVQRHFASKRIVPRSENRIPADVQSVPTPANLRRLRSKEHRLRKAIIQGFLTATVVAYYLDGKYNARAVRRTLRTAWVGATLAVDYKWNFTWILPFYFYLY